MAHLWKLHYFWGWVVLLLLLLEWPCRVQRNTVGGSGGYPYFALADGGTDGTTDDNGTDNTFGGAGFLTQSLGGARMWPTCFTTRFTRQSFIDRRARGAWPS